MTTTLQFGRAFVDDGFHLAIGRVGPKWLQLVHQDGCRVRVSRVRVSEAGRRPFRPVPGLTLERLAKRWLKPRNALGLAQHVDAGARRILQEALQ